jgi:hypothetical protein
MSVVSGPMVPTIHLNGTSRRDIEDQLIDAGHALRAALEALQQAAPNARDYYPQGPEAFPVAQAQHEARWLAVKGVFSEIELILDKVAN